MKRSLWLILWFRRLRDKFLCFCFGHKHKLEIGKLQPCQTTIAMMLCDRCGKILDSKDCDNKGFKQQNIKH